MRTVTLIGRVALAAIVLTLAAMPSSAQARARGFRLRFGVGSAEAAVPASPPARTSERMAAAGGAVAFAPVTVSAAVQQAAPRPPTSGHDEAAKAPVPEVAGMDAEPVAKSAAQPVRVAGPWCPSQRIVGAGAGFCIVN